MIDAIILAGGLGTRLAQTVPHLPKALAPIQGIPFIQLLLKQLETSGIVSKIVFALGHKADAIQAFLQTQSTRIPIEVSVEPTPLGTGGALLYALNKTESETLLVLNGDTYFDLPLCHFFEFHQIREADITLACRKVKDTSRFGSVIIAPDQRIISFREKEPIPYPGWINGGLYLIEKNLLSSFPPGTHSIETDFFPHLLEKKVLAYTDSGCFVDIGTQETYFAAQELLKPWT